MPEKSTTVLITGASTGFGRLFAEHVARNGYQVFATMRNLEGRNAASGSELRALAAREALDLHVAEMDVCDDASVDRCVSQVIENAGRIDVLINNAGFGYLGLLESFTIEPSGSSTRTFSVRCGRSAPCSHRCTASEAASSFR